MPNSSSTFGNNYVLVSAAYNAGPIPPDPLDGGTRRPAVGDGSTWSTGSSTIPFTETRNYVMRVMESLPVYRARLSGQVQPIRLSERLRQR